MIKLVAFDWNGTLLADTYACLKADNYMITTLGGQPVSVKTFREKFTVPVIDYYVSIGLNHQMLSKNKSINEQLFHKRYEELAVNTRTRQGTRHLLDWLREHSIESIILSNHSVIGIEKQLKRLKIEKYFAKILANTELDVAFVNKTKQGRLKTYLAANKLKPDQVLIVGDSTEEIEIGQQLGTLTCAITNGYNSTRRLKAAKPDYLINNLGEVLNIVQTLNS